MTTHASTGADRAQAHPVNPPPPFQRVRELIRNDLLPHERLLLLLRHAEGMNNHEIAAILEMTPEHVERVYQRVVDQLAERIKTQAA